jgi:oxygen-independent coproporphyrinogen-3 oxidase
MCDFSVDLDSIHGNGDIGVGKEFEVELEALAPLADEGLLSLDGKRILVTEKGRPFVRLAAAAFDAYLRNASTRHSVAV